MSRAISGLSITALALIIGVSAQASTSTWISTGQGEVEIITGLNTITVTLTDLYVNPTSVSDNISAFSFTLSSSPTSDSITSSSGEQVTVNGPGYTLGSTVAPGWGLSLVGATTTLDDLASGAAGPADTLIGTPGTNGYTNANGSIAGNGPHNPFLYETATWTLDETGITAATTVLAASFQFGTTDGQNEVSAKLLATPEPSTFALFGAAGILVLAFGRKYNAVLAQAKIKNQSSSY